LRIIEGYVFYPSTFTDDRSHAYGSRIMRGGSGAMRKDKGPRAEDKKKRKGSNGEGARWQEQGESKSAGGKNGGTLR
jgi:hypothetical protein